MLARIRAAPALEVAARTTALEAHDATLETLRSLPVRRNHLISTFEHCRDQLHSGKAPHTNDINDELAKFTGDLLRSGWPQTVSSGNPGDKVVNAVSEIFSASHSQIMNLETLMSFDDFRDKHGEPQRVQLEACVEDIMSSARAIGVEKFGVHPILDISVASGVAIDQAAAPLLEFSMIELLKNAFGTMMDRYGALEVEDASPVKVYFEGKGTHLQRVLVEDTGAGMDEKAQRGCFQPLVTSLVDDREDPWKYSRTFGARFSGAGLGAFRARLSFLHLGAKDVILSSSPNAGTSIEVLF